MKGIFGFGGDDGFGKSFSDMNGTMKGGIIGSLVVTLVLGVGFLGVVVFAIIKFAH